MGSSKEQLITLLFVCFIFQTNVANIYAKPSADGGQHSERQEYNYQRSESRSVSGQQSPRDWMQQVNDQLMSQLQNQRNPSEVTIIADCNTLCKQLNRIKSEAEIESIAHEMSNQIVMEMQNGQLQRSEMNKANWYEDRVAQKWKDIQAIHQIELEKNMLQASARYRNRLGYTEDQVRNNANVQQIVSGQRQYQQQGNSYQYQNQQQQQSVYRQPYRPVNPPVYNNYYQTSVVDDNNCTFYPTAPILPTTSYNKYDETRTDEHRQTNHPTLIGTNSYNLQKEQKEEEVIRNNVRPIVPTQHTYIDRTLDIQQNTRNQVVAPLPTPQQQDINVYEQSYFNRSENYIPSQPGTLITNSVQSKQEETTRQTSNQQTAVSTIRHNIYNFVAREDEVPGYRPRVVIDQNTQQLDETKEQNYREQVCILVKKKTAKFNK